MYYTQTDIINMQVNANAPMTINEIIKELIKEDGSSKFKENMADGVLYYGADQDIDDINFTEYTNKDGDKATQKNKANNHLTHVFHRLQVIEKVAYLLKSPPTITHPKDGVINEMTKLLGTDFDDFLIDWATNASNKGVEYVYPYVEKNEFKYVIINAEQCIPIYDTNFQKIIVEMFRYYKIKVSERGNKAEDRYRVEWYYPDRIDVYEQNKKGEYELTETKIYFIKYASKNRKATETAGDWGRVPFIELPNNSNKHTDLRFNKSLIDDYDKGASIFSNNLEDIQEAIITATGSGVDPEELRQKLREFKVIVTGDVDSNINNLTTEIPYEARMAHLKNLEDNIYAFGMAINPKADELGNDPSGVALEKQYRPLDLKAGMLERKLEKALYELFWFVSQSQKIRGKSEIDSSEFKFTFNKSMITNEKDLVETLVNDTTISDKTKRENDPFVKDEAEEKKRLDEEREERKKNMDTIPLVDNNDQE